MSKQTGRVSIIVSAVLGGLFLAAMAVAGFWVPPVINSMIDVKDNIGNRGEIGEWGRSFVIADAYVMIAIAAVAVILLFVLLRVVYRRQVFSAKTARLLSAISWCCFAEGLFALFMIAYFQLVVCVTLAASFLGLCLRVVMHVIEEATRIKCENDYTI